VSSPPCSRRPAKVEEAMVREMLERLDEIEGRLADLRGSL
jgi:hypothetical protein